MPGRDSSGSWILRCAQNDNLQQACDTLTLIMGAHLLERPCFELAHALARDAQFFANFDQGTAPTIADAIAQGDNRVLSLGQLRERTMQLLAHQMTRGAFSEWRGDGIFNRIGQGVADRKSTRLNSSHSQISYA